MTFTGFEGEGGKGEGGKWGAPGVTSLFEPKCQYPTNPFTPTKTMIASTSASKAYFFLFTRYETYLIPGETLIPGGRGEAFHPGIGYASYLLFTHRASVYFTSAIK